MEVSRTRDAALMPRCISTRRETGNSKNNGHRLPHQANLKRSREDGWGEGGVENAALMPWCISIGNGTGPFCSRVQRGDGVMSSSSRLRSMFEILFPILKKCSVTKSYSGNA